MGFEGKPDELVKKGLHFLGLNLYNMCFGRYFLQRENQKGGIEAKRSKFWMKMRGLRQAEEILEDLDRSRSKICKVLYKKVIYLC